MNYLIDIFISTGNNTGNCNVLYCSMLEEAKVRRDVRAGKLILKNVGDIQKM